MKSLFYVLTMLIAFLFFTGCSEETKETVEEFIEEYDEIGVYVNNISLKIKNPEGSKYKWGEKIPTLEEKELIAEYLFKNDNLIKKDVCIVTLCARKFSRTSG